MELLMNGSEYVGDKGLPSKGVETAKWNCQSNQRSVISHTKLSQSSEGLPLWHPWPWWPPVVLSWHVGPAERDRERDTKTERERPGERQRVRWVNNISALICKVSKWRSFSQKELERFIPNHEWTLHMTIMETITADIRYVSNNPVHLYDHMLVFSYLRM